MGYLLEGRPFGGCAIIWSKNATSEIKPVELPSKRACAISFTLNGTKLILCNVYMPCDTNTDRNNLEEFQYTLDCISKMLTNKNASYMIIGGDFNTNFVRNESLHTISLKNFFR